MFGTSRTAVYPCLTSGRRNLATPCSRHSMNASALEAILYLAIQAPDNYLAIQSFYCLLSNQLTNQFFWRNIDYWQATSMYCTPASGTACCYRVQLLLWANGLGSLVKMSWSDRSFWLSKLQDSHSSHLRLPSFKNGFRNCILIRFLCKEDCVCSRPQSMIRYWHRGYYDTNCKVATQRTAQGPKFGETLYKIAFYLCILVPHNGYIVLGHHSRSPGLHFYLRRSPGQNCTHMAKIFSALLQIQMS